MTNENAAPAQFETGAIRGKRTGDRVRWDLLDSNDVAMRRLAETFAEGFKKYGADNWKKGFPTSELYNHVREHMLLWISGDKSEDHLAHAAWNIMAIMWQEEKLPHLQDFPPICNVANQNGVVGDHAILTKRINPLACPLYEGTIREGEEFHSEYVYASTREFNGRCAHCGAPKHRHYRGFEEPINTTKPKL